MRNSNSRSGQTAFRNASPVTNQCAEHALTTRALNPSSGIAVAHAEVAPCPLWNTGRYSLAGRRKCRPSPETRQTTRLELLQNRVPPGLKFRLPPFSPPPQTHETATGADALNPTVTSCRRWDHLLAVHHISLVSESKKTRVGNYFTSQIGIFRT